MPVVMIPLRPEMAHELGKMYLDAFGGYQANRIMVPDRTPEAEASFAAVERADIEGQSEHDFLFGMIDTDLPSTNPDIPEGQLIGNCKWRHERAVERDSRPFVVSERPGTNMEARKEFFGLLNAAETGQMKGKDYMHLMFVATRPEHGGRGVASIGLEWGVKKADEMKLPAYMNATPQGKRLYEKFGFTSVGEIAWDLRKYGGDETYHNYVMVREAKV